jgi:Invasin, domain 3/Calcineurin-like phosphoesterase
MRLRPLLAIPAVALTVLGLATCTADSGLTGISDDGRSPAFRPARGAAAVVGTPAIMIGAGDISTCTNNLDESTARIIDTVPGTVYTLGDNIYPDGLASEFNNCYEPTWGRHKARTRPSAGNSDYETSGALPYFNYFGTAAGQPGQGYYSYNLGAWHVVVLNSNIPRTPSSPQMQWLRSDLDANPSQCTLAYFHHPLFSSVNGTGTGGDVWTSVRPFWDTLYSRGADVVLSGHRHSYERMAPLRPDGTPDATFGIREFVVGTGGVGGGTLSNLHPASEVRNGDTRGALKLYLYDDSYAWKFIPIAGKTFTDSGSVACHPAPGGVAPAVSPTLSTIAADPTTIVAGSSSSTITVTARNPSGDPVSGVTVVLSATGGGNTIVQPSGPTDAAGVATGSFSSTVAAASKTISAVIGGVAVTQTAVVRVNAGAPSAARSTVAASPTSIVAGGGSSTVTVTVRDPHGNPVSGATVALSASGTGNSLTQPGGTTNGNGLAIGALTSSEAGVKTVSATAEGTSITQTADVTVTPPAGGGGQIVHTLLTSGNGTDNVKVYTTASISPAANALITVAVLGHRASAASAAPTLTGGGMTSWSQVASVAFDSVGGPLKRLTVYRALSSAPGSGPITITFPSTLSNAQWIVSQWSGVDATGTNGAGAIVQSVSVSGDRVSGLTATLAPLGAPHHVAYGVVGVNGNGLVVSPGAGFTEIAEQSSGEAARAVLQTEWATGDNTVDASGPGSLNAAILGIELKPAP